MEVAKDSGESYLPRTVIFRRALDAEMKNATKEGFHIKCQKEEKEFVTAEKERKFWEMNL
ncbi:unnamed protein product [Pocillopora meandrina]|uniref:Uncharacterized protein n=1 Tax=Pocillopora meandrina TaxID=46732 RepID=A0AAU9WY27_9CNID|nr:unnamed protein product [Pocillopora meandrina]